MPTPIIRCVDVHKTFSFKEGGIDGIHVLKGVSLEVNEKEIVSIVGASGAGKSTLLHIMGGLDRPTGGTVFWRDADIFRLREYELPLLRAKTVGFVFQFHHLLPEFTALENVAIPSMILRETKDRAFERAREFLARVGLEGRMHHKPAELSGGEQQRVAVARALVNQPQVILADEPSGNLDSLNTKHLYELFETLNRRDGQTFVIVTHNEQLARRAHRMLRMSDGMLQGD